MNNVPDDSGGDDVRTYRGDPARLSMCGRVCFRRGSEDAPKPQRLTGSDDRPHAVGRGGAAGIVKAGRFTPPDNAERRRMRSQRTCQRMPGRADRSRLGRPHHAAGPRRAGSRDPDDAGDAHPSTTSGRGRGRPPSAPRAPGIASLSGRARPRGHSNTERPEVTGPGSIRWRPWTEAQLPRQIERARRRRDGTFDQGVKRPCWRAVDARINRPRRTSHPGHRKARNLSVGE